MPAFKMAPLALEMLASLLINGARNWVWKWNGTGRDNAHFSKRTLST